MQLKKNNSNNDSHSLEKTVHPRYSFLEIAVLSITLIWIIGSLFMFATGRLNSISVITNQLVTIFMPVAIGFLCLIIMRSSKVMQEESQKLQTAVAALRRAYIEQQKAQGQWPPQSSLGQKLDSIADTQQKIEVNLAILSSNQQDQRQIPTKNISDGDKSLDESEQTTLEFGTPSDALTSPISNENFIKALNFPENPNDEDGFVALHLGLKDRDTAKVIQASQDILTFLSHDGIYMDDLRPTIARPEIWRKFANGERGRVISSLGGIRDRSSLALTNGRMKQDPIFRDAAHHFLRTFDKEFSTFEKSATDTEISAFAETRTARAFMLIGRVSGTFD